MPHGIEYRLYPQVIGDLTAGTRRLAECKQIFFLLHGFNGCGHGCNAVEQRHHKLVAPVLKFRFRQAVLRHGSADGGNAGVAIFGSGQRLRHNSQRGIA